MIQINVGVGAGSKVTLMRPTFQIVPLTGDLAIQALPLIRATWPDTELKDWQRYVTFFNHGSDAQPCGIMAMVDSGDNLCGIMAYRRDQDLKAGTIFSIPLFTAMDLGNSLPTVRGLLNAAETRAEELGCDDIHVQIHPAQARLAGRLRHLGMTDHYGLFRKSIEPFGTTN